MTKLKRSKEMGGLGAKIEIVSRELIKPSSPTPPYNHISLKLSLLDQYVPPAFVPLLFLYQKPASVDHSASKTTTSLHLKQSLSEALTKFYPLAGKLNPPDLLSIDCDGSGALFVEAKVDAPFSEAFQNGPHENSVQYLPFDPFEIAAANGVGDHDDDQVEVLLLGTYPRNEILLGVQISRFKCGGSAIGVCISHKVADFASLVTFMNSWAAVNRGDDQDDYFGESFLKEPKFDVGRHLFPPTDVPFSGFPPSSAEKGKKIVFKRFLFSKEKLTQLKEQATSTNSSSSISLVKDPTRVEVVSAFLWRQFIKLAQAKKNDHFAQRTTDTRLFRICHVVNLRSRMSCLSALSNEGLFPFGNLVIPAIASFSSSGTDHHDHSDDDEEENQEEKIRDYYGNLVWLTRTAIRKVNDDYVVNCAVPLIKRMMDQEEEVRPQPMMSDWVVTSWCRFPTYEVDFGWGKPLLVRPAGTPNHPAVVLTTTSREEEGIEAWVAMFEDEYALLPDEILSLAATEFFHLS